MGLRERWVAPTPPPRVPFCHHRCRLLWLIGEAGRAGFGRFRFSGSVFAEQWYLFLPALPCLHVCCCGGLFGRDFWSWITSDRICYDREAVEKGTGSQRDGCEVLSLPLFETRRCFDFGVSQSASLLSFPLCGGFDRRATRVFPWTSQKSYIQSRIISYRAAIFVQSSGSSCWS